jgi:hypothetical protein
MATTSWPNVRPHWRGAGALRNGNTCSSPRPVRADCSAFHLLSLLFPKGFLKKRRGQRVRVLRVLIPNVPCGPLRRSRRATRKGGPRLRTSVFLSVHMPVAERPEPRHAGPNDVNPVKVRGPTGLYAREAEPRRTGRAATPSRVASGLRRAPAFAKRYGAASRPRKAAICQANLSWGQDGFALLFCRDRRGLLCPGRPPAGGPGKGEDFFWGTCTQGVVRRLTVPWATIGPHLRRSP